MDKKKKKEVTIVLRDRINFGLRFHKCKLLLYITMLVLIYSKQLTESDFFNHNHNHNMYQM